jgi:hypothetical protein
VLFGDARLTVAERTNGAASVATDAAGKLRHPEIPPFFGRKAFQVSDLGVKGMFGSRRLNAAGVAYKMVVNVRDFHWASDAFICQPAINDDAVAHDADDGNIFPLDLVLLNEPDD